MVVIVMCHNGWTMVGSLNVRWQGSNALSWIPATEHSNLQSLSMKAAAPTTMPYPHHLNISNNALILIYFNGDNKSASYNQMLSMIK